MFNIENKQPKDGEICYVIHNGEYYIIEDVLGNAYRAPMQFIELNPNDSGVDWDFMHIGDESLLSMDGYESTDIVEWEYVTEDGSYTSEDYDLDLENAYKLSRRNGTFTEEEFPNVTSLKLIRV